MDLGVKKDNFYSRSLSGVDRVVYDKCVDGLNRGETSISMTLPPFSRKVDTQRVTSAVFFGCPEFFFIDSSAQLSWLGNKLEITFERTYSDIEAKRRELSAAVDAIAARLCSCGSTRDKLIKLSSLLGDAVKGGKGGCGDAYGALVLGNARCEGYAKAAKLIMDKARIESVLAVGDAVSESGRSGHAWNIAYCNGKPYGFDFTWNDGGDAGSIHHLEYLFLPDSEMSVDHFPEYKYPACTDGSMTFWARNGTVVRSESDIARLQPKKMLDRYVAVVKFDGIAATERLQRRVIDRISAHVLDKFGSCSINYRYNDRLHVLAVYCTAGK